MDQGKLNIQHVKKVVSDSLGLVDIDVRLVNSALNVAIEQVKFLGNSNNRRTVINPAHHIFVFRPVKMTVGQVHASYSLPKLQAVKLTFFTS